jgi:hypothetical protein
MKHLLWIAWVLLPMFAVGTEQPAEGTEIHLRVANLMPLGPGRAELQRGGEPFLSGLKPGFLMPYLPVEKKGPWEFQTVWEGRPIGSFKLDPSKSPAYYTVVFMEKGGQPHMEFTRDDPEPPKEGDFSFPSRRLRAFLPSMGFPYTVEAGSEGPWEIDRESRIVDITVDAAPPTMAKLTYTTRDGDEVELFYPLDFEAHPRQAIFVSQRGAHRPRLRCWPDNAKPSADSEDPLPAPPTEGNGAVPVPRLTTP